MVKQVLTPDERLKRMEDNMQRFRVPTIEKQPEHPDVLSICGYGPSLAETWQDIRGYVMTCSGAHDFLIERGIIPQLHCEVDPREYKFRFVRNSRAETIYLLASVCHPWIFRQLADRQVVMWHARTDDDAARQIALVKGLHPWANLLAGGTNAGMRALAVGLELGFRRFELHGIDCCYRGSQQWAGLHYGPRHVQVRVRVDGREFDTSDVMIQSTEDFFNLLPMLVAARNNSAFKFRGALPVKVHGDGLLAKRLEMFVHDSAKATAPGWWKPTDFSVKVVDPADWSESIEVIEAA